MLENAVDSEPTKISIKIINAGLDLVVIEDNGKGIHHKDLALAFCRHATSKIINFEDIYSLHTYGFRGEALASISSVSKVTCSSNKAKSPRATLKVNGGQQDDIELDSKELQSSGTSIFVKDLFYNTPVRMKFMQSQTSEKNQIKKIINSFILTQPSIEFDLTWDDQTKIRYQKVDKTSLSKRIQALFEKRNSPLELLEVEASYDGFHVKTYLSKSSAKGFSHKFNYIFVNDRLVTDIQIHKILLNSAAGHWPIGETGNYCIFISVPTDQLDVNVHPNKTIVKIFQAPKLYSLISGSIKQSIPQERKTNFISTQTDIQLSQSNNTPQSFEYKEQDFNSSFDMQNYFNKLDHTNHLNGQTQDSVKLLYQKKGLTLFLYHDEIYLIKDLSFIFSQMMKAINGKATEPTPLLVSKPFDLLSSSKDKILDDALKMGFEFDRIDEQTLALRSFPQGLTELPYLDFAQNLINNIKNNKDILNGDRFESQYIITVHDLEKTIESSGITRLIQEKAITCITHKDLEKLL